MSSPTSTPEADSTRSFYRVPCELQLRYRAIKDDELHIFRSFGLRPSPYGSMKAEVERQLASMPIRDESKVLLEKAFQILLNIDQRLERLEEQVANVAAGTKSALEGYEWVHGDLGAGGLAFVQEAQKMPVHGATLLLDIILPSMPEYRFVAAGKVVHTDATGKIGTEFVAIHEDDKEFIHRFVISREREILRARAQEREKTSEPK